MSDPKDVLSILDFKSAELKVYITARGSSVVNKSTYKLLCLALKLRLANVPLKLSAQERTQRLENEY